MLISFAEVSRGCGGGKVRHPIRGNFTWYGGGKCSNFIRGDFSGMWWWGSMFWEPTEDARGGTGLVPLAGRTKEGLQNLVQRLKEVPGGVRGLSGPLRSAASTVLSNVATHSLRGIVFPDGDVVWGRPLPPKAPAVWFAFSGRDV